MATGTTIRMPVSPRAAADRLAEAHRASVGLRARLRGCQDEVELVEARLILSEAYSAGRNAETRAAWLKLQRTQDADYAAALAALEAARRELEAAEATEQEWANELRVAIEEMRLERAYLLARAGQED